jgi:cytochrome c2
MFALHVPEGTPPSPFLKPGRFTARLTGLVKTSLKGDYRFRVAGAGAVSLTINSQKVIEADLSTNPTATVELVKGYNQIDLFYQSPIRGDATVRLYWTGEGFNEEPVPPDEITMRGDDEALLAGQQKRDGRQLFGTMGCSRCHALPGNLKAADCAMPELEHRAPSLVDAGHRFSEAWLATWIADPRSIRRDATMPKLASAADGVDLAAYVASLKSGAAPADNVAGDAASGEKNFQKLGCVACHHLQDPAKDDDFGRVGLKHVGAKFRPGALAAFLKAPTKHYPWIRMPDFKFTDKEAADLAAFLSKHSDNSDAPKAGQPDRGAKLFKELSCARCHATSAKEDVSLPVLPAPTKLTQGCLAEREHGKAPDFEMSNDSRRALRAFLATDGSSLTRETAAEFSLRQVKSLQCVSCHRRDGVVPRWHNVHEAEGDGSQLEFLPILTWTGQKLKPDWTVKLLAGLHDHRARPWLKTRMPAFPTRAEQLAVGLSHEHGYGVNDDPRPKPDAQLAEIGKKLLPQAGGFNCVQCHGVGKTPPVAPFEAHGINLLDAAERLRYEYYARWMLDPPRVDITTRMQKIAVDGKTTALRDVEGGDARRQFDAIWHYLQTLPARKE